MAQRIIGIDITRAIAILLVTFTHSMSAYDAHGRLTGAAHYGLEILLQSATPIFLILFGVMLELVYCRRCDLGDVLDCQRRLRRRAWHCYAYYSFVICVLFVVQGAYNWVALPMVFAFMISVPYSNLLAFYAIALSLAPGLIHLRRTYGLLPLIVTASLVHVLHPVLMHLPPGPEIAGRDYLQHLSGVIYGRGVSFYGPSLIHGVSMVCFGMLFGWALSDLKRSGYRIRQPAWRIMLLIGGLIIALIIYIDWTAPTEFLSALSDQSLRRDSHPMYFAFGMIITSVLGVMCIYLYDVCGLRYGRCLMVFGRRSLFAFGFGNALIILAPATLGHYLGRWVAVWLLFALICGLTIVYDHIVRRGYADSVLAPIRS